MTPQAISPGRRVRFPLFARVLLAALAGAALGSMAGSAEVLGVSASDLGAAGMLVIKALKILATPLIFLAVVDASVRICLPARKAGVLLLVAAANGAVAVAIGLGVAHVLGAGQGAFKAILDATSADAIPAPPITDRAISSLLPASIVEPFASGSIVAVVVLALLFGSALRAVRKDEPAGVAAVESAVRAALAACSKVLSWIVATMPFAVFAVVTQVVAKAGLSLVRDLGMFLVTMLVGLALHVFVYYALVLWLAARRSPLGFLRGAADALATAISCSSSLATLPVTLRCLADLRITPGSARLASCVGTNLNHDGIILYEAAAAIFVAQALGMDLGVGQQLAIALAAVVAGVGIAGIPEAGLVTLPLVLGAAGIPVAAVASVVPALLPVDWIIGRCRAATNVASDMVVAAVIDRFSPDRQNEEEVAHV